MTIRKGVRIYLPPGTRLPRWVRNQDKNIEYERRRIGRGCYVYVLSIRGGEAHFMPGGDVYVKMPGSSEYWGFSQKVLEIRDAGNRLVKRNYYCCKKCMRLTGAVKTSQVGTRPGYRNVTMACEPCQRNWTLENI